ncbi:hypothetical protein OnM2_074049 [Erysiphe neolycopersici]|uniref:SnoaL-like polyketide cyclase n=1 Tax=Erysiphe neolycopersici TaxID=212602 RepID=A0A420HJ54_9PEZI|nr:hypothetical protein OnM2_074049 [Erysiphe neolycopersici]
MVKNFYSPSSHKTTFLAYIEALNTHKPQTSTLDLSNYMHSELTVNNETYTLSEYETSLLKLMNAASDFHISVQKLVVEGPTVATRFLVTCTPEKQYMGYPPNGKRIEYAEHVFYRFNGTKCCEISALIDIRAVKRQLGDK